MHQIDIEVPSASLLTLTIVAEHHSLIEVKLFSSAKATEYATPAHRDQANVNGATEHHLIFDLKAGKGAILQITSRSIGTSIPCSTMDVAFSITTIALLKKEHKCESGIPSLLKVLPDLANNDL